MGDEKRDVAVTDAGPIIHLHEISRIALLGVFAAVHIGQCVWDEAVTSGRVSEPELRNATLFHRHIVSPQDIAVVTDATASTLHRGEVECLALCRLLGVSLLLTDDLAARSVAASFGVRPVGSLGVVVRAFRIGRISFAQAKECLDALNDISSLFVTRAVIDLALEQLAIIRPDNYE